MKTEKNILTAFLLNFLFAIAEFIGGVWTRSVAIMSDSVHDAGDALSIGIAYILERKSKKKPDDVFTYGYARYSAFGSVITGVILLSGSVYMISRSVFRLINPVEINYGGMILFAVFGVAINSVAAFLTKSGDSLNQKAVNIHMLEDVLGWVVVLIGSIAMKFTDFRRIDPLMSIAVSLFIFIQTVKTLKEALDMFLEKIPRGISVETMKENLLKLDGIKDVHHIHIWSFDNVNICATMHIVTEADSVQIKKSVRKDLCKYGITHATLELESPMEECAEQTCTVITDDADTHTHCH